MGLSILIPVYNWDPTPLVNTLIEQKNNLDYPIEIHLCDDASTQKKINLDKYATVYQHRNESNLGSLHTRILLANKANYTNLLFLDADVAPAFPDFLKKYLNHINDYDIIFGGILVSKQNKPQNQLRYRYGLKREARDINKRLKKPYTSIVSASFLIKKDIYLKSVPKDKVGYGNDILIAYTFKKNNFHIKHIDNPVYHKGLEDNAAFLLKTQRAMQTLAKLENNNKIPKNLTGVQLARNKVKQVYLHQLYTFTFSLFKNRINKNLKSKSPSLFLFDLYKLNCLLLSSQ